MTPLTVEIHEKGFQLEKPIRSAQGLIEERLVLELKLQHPSGVFGLGEASPLPGFSPDTYEECKQQLYDAKQELEELEANDLWQGIVLRCQSLSLSPAAQHAVEEALWNLSAALAEIEPEEMLASEFNQVTLHHLVVDAESAKKAGLAGFNHVKVKVGHEEIAKSMNRIRSISEALPEDARIRLDANGQWNAEILGTLSQDLLNMKVWCIEEPVSGLENLAELRLNCPLKILADESVRSPDDLDTCIRLNAVHGVVLKPMLIGGPLSAYALAEQAMEAGLGVSITTTFDGPTARASASRIASSLDGRQLLSCGLQTGRFFNPPQKEIASIHQGAFSLDSRS